MSQHLVFDVQVIVDLWLNTGSASVTDVLLNTATAAGAKRWMTATSLSLLDNTAKSALMQQRHLTTEEASRTVAQYMTQWLTKIDVLTDHGFEQSELYNRASCFQDAQIAAATRSLAGQQVCIVTENAQFDSLGEVACKTPADALTWLAKHEAQEPSESLPFIDLTTQQAAIRSKLERGIELVLRHGQYILGPEVKELEAKLASNTEAKHCITVSSGTDALLISLMALGIGPGDEVITTTFTFVATAEVIVLAGAKPIFVDIDPVTCNIDADLIEAKITANTKAIMPVSLYGQPADMDKINAVALRYGIPVIEDAAQSFGAEYRGRKSCNLSTVGCTSFFPSKPLGCYGDGGAIFTNDDGIAQTCRELRVHGQSQRYRHTKIGVCGRMDGLQAAVVLAKLERFATELEQRQVVAMRYQQLLGGEQNRSTIRPLPWPQSDRTSVFAQYTVFAQDRDEVQNRLSAVGIPSAVHYPIPLTEQPAYQSWADPSMTPVATAVAKQVLSLPMGPDLKPTDQTRVVKHILRIQD